ncbi:MAG: V0D/AC39 family V-type ATPase subunit [Candidatus Merdivicinus sp.]|jgi:V/A-type H+-transporting ATPase subunit C
MLRLYSGNAILAKIRAIFGKRLTRADYAQMARKRDVSEVAALLKENTSYQATLKNVSETTVHRGQLEALLKKDIFYKYSVLRNYDASDNGFYDFIIVRLEIDEILRCLMLMRSRESTDFVVDMPAFLLNHTSFNLMDLARVADNRSLLDCLEHTPYAGVLRPYLQTEDGEVDPWEVEHALYCYYYGFLLGEIEKQFRGQTREQLRKVVLAEVEAKNIQLIFRLKFYYGLDAVRIRGYLYPYHYRLKGQRLEAVLAAEDYAGMLAALDFLSQESWQRPEEDGIEPYTHLLCYRLEKRLLRFTTNAPVAMYTFLALREIEVANIVTVIEGVRYQIPQEEILKMLIL